MIFYVFLIIVVCFVLGLIVLIQNPKGGGLASNVGGFSNQLMGVKQTTDVLEKGTWVTAIIVGLLCLFSAVLIPKGGSDARNAPKLTPQQQQAPASGTPAPANSTPLRP